MQKVRILFSKKNKAKFISHLDLVRVVTRAIKRADLPIVYSQGFNPTPRLSFALPMSLGHESECEIMNFKVDPDMSCAEIENRLSKQLPDGFHIKDVYIPDDNGAELYAAEYSIIIYGNTVNNEDIVKILEQPTAEIIKKTKSGEKLTDIKPFIYKYAVESNDDKIVLTCVLNAKDPHFLNPEYVVKLLFEKLSVQFEYSILRNEIYDEKMNVYR